MAQYDLVHRYLDVLVNDFTTPTWRSDLIFDSIVTDRKPLLDTYNNYAI